MADNLKTLTSQVDTAIPINGGVASVKTQNHNPLEKDIIGKVGKMTGFQFTSARTPVNNTVGSGMIFWNGNSMNSTNEFLISLGKYSLDGNNIFNILDTLENGSIIHFKDFVGRSTTIKFLGYEVKEDDLGSEYAEIKVIGFSDNTNYAYQIGEFENCMISFINKHEEDYLNVLDFGAVADGTFDGVISIIQEGEPNYENFTDNTPFFQLAVNSAIEQNKPLFIPKQDLPYTLSSITSGIEINGSIKIFSNGAVLNAGFRNLSVKAIFHLGNVDESTEIDIKGLNTIGRRTEQKFIISQWGTGATPNPRKLIKRLTLKDINTENQNLTVNFNPEYIHLENIHTGLNTQSEDNINPGIFITYDNTYTIGKQLYVNNCSVTAGNRDTDMFFLKGGSYKDVRFTNLTANMLAFIAIMGGDGFDMDDIGENVFIDNIKAIGCGVEIKAGNNAFGSYALNAGNITCVNPSNGGISTRAIGNYNNLICRNPVATGVAIAGFTSAPIDGSTSKDTHININNILVTNAGDKNTSSAMVTIGNDNVNINNLQIVNEFGYTGNTQTGLRISNTENCNIVNCMIEDTFNAVVFASGATIDKIRFSNLNIDRCSGNVLQFGSTYISNLIINGFDLKGFAGSNIISINSIFENIRLNNFEPYVIENLVQMTGFTAYSHEFLFNNVVYDKTLNAGQSPIDNVNYPIGLEVINVSDGRTWKKTGVGSYSVLNNFNTLPTGSPAINTYLSGANTWESISNRVRSTTIGVMVPTNVALTSSDTFQDAVQKLQGQLNNLQSQINEL